MLELLDSGDVDAATPRLSERLLGYLDQGWSLDDHLREVWQPGLEDLAGSRRAITEESQVSPTSVRFAVTGDRGRALVTMRFDDDGRVDGFAIDREVLEGIANFVITCPPAPWSSADRNLCSTL